MIAARTFRQFIPAVINLRDNMTFIVKLFGKALLLFLIVRNIIQVLPVFGINRFDCIFAAVITGREHGTQTVEDIITGIIAFFGFERGKIPAGIRQIQRKSFGYGIGVSFQIKRQFIQLRGYIQAFRIRIGQSRKLGRFRSATGIFRRGADNFAAGKRDFAGIGTVYLCSSFLFAVFICKLRGNFPGREIAGQPANDFSVLITFAEGYLLGREKAACGSVFYPLFVIYFCSQIARSVKLLLDAVFQTADIGGYAPNHSRIVITYLRHCITAHIGDFIYKVFPIRQAALVIRYIPLIFIKFNQLFQAQFHNLVLTIRRIQFGSKIQHPGIFDFLYHAALTVKKQGFAVFLTDWKRCGYTPVGIICDDVALANRLLFSQRLLRVFFGQNPRNFLPQCPVVVVFLFGADFIILVQICRLRCQTPIHIVIFRIKPFAVIQRSYLAGNLPVGMIIVQHLFNDFAVFYRFFGNNLAIRRHQLFNMTIGDFLFYYFGLVCFLLCNWGSRRYCTCISGCFRHSSRCGFFFIQFINSRRRRRGRLFRRSGRYGIRHGRQRNSQQQS